MPKAGASVSIPPLTPSLLAVPTYVLARAGRMARRLSQDAIDDSGLLLPHFSVLVTLDDVGPLPQHELADRLRIHRSHLVRYVDELETRKAIRRQRDPDDRRRQVVSLTAPGQKLLAEMWKRMAEAQDEILSPLSRHERTVLTDLLGRLLQHADQPGDTRHDAAPNDRQNCAG